MNSTALFLILALSAVIVSAKYVQKRQYGPDSDDDERIRDMMACEMGMMPCISDLNEKYRLDNPMLSAGIASNVGARNVCRDVQKAEKCVLKNLDEPSCQTLKVQVNEALEVSKDLLDYLCVRKIDDLATHWKCLTTSVPNEQDLMKCSTIRPRSRCDISPIVDCVADVLESLPGCNPGVGDLVREVFEKVRPLIVEPCTADDINYQATRMLNQIFRRK